MNVLYAKCILYSYSSLDAVIGQIDELVEKKALSSMTDTSYAYYQCAKIVEFTAQKDLLIETKNAVDKILERLDPYDAECLDYKYVKSKPKNEYRLIDTSRRAYFRRQIKIAEKFAERLEKFGINDQRFEKEFLRMEFFAELLRRVKEYEILCRKNGRAYVEKSKPKVEKIKAAV